eukprot:scaffold251730_cov19-Tisochrysis_lutea.AAC.1
MQALRYSQAWLALQSGMALHFEQLRTSLALQSGMAWHFEQEKTARFTKCCAPCHEHLARFAADQLELKDEPDIDTLLAEVRLSSFT